MPPGCGTEQEQVARPPRLLSSVLQPKLFCRKDDFGCSVLQVLTYRFESLPYAIPKNLC